MDAQGTDATHLPLKVKLGDDIRRFIVQRDITYVELHQLIAKHFTLNPETIQLKYFDDEEELITLGSDLELQEAKRLQPKVLRLNIYEAKPKQQNKDGSSNLRKLESAFVRDVTVPDGTPVTAGVKFRKVWCVRNTGTEPWPKGVVLKMVDPEDDQLVVLASGAVNRTVQPGEECDIGVELQAPSRPGRCVQYWRLFTEDGEAFGARFWIDITVTVAPQAVAAVEEALRREDEEARKRQEEEEMRAEAEMQEQRRLAEEEASRAAEEAELRRLQEELELERQRLLMEQEEQARRAAEEAERRQQEQAREAELKRLQEEQERKRAAEEARRAAEEAELRRQQEELKRKEEEELKRRNSKYTAQLTALAEMGFTDVASNVRLLEKHKGNLDLALEALLAGN